MLIIFIITHVYNFIETKHIYFYLRISTLLHHLYLALVDICFEMFDIPLFESNLY
jgi:hypothetical protein